MRNKRNRKFSHFENAEIAQLVEHNLVAKDKRFQPWQGKVILKSTK